MKIFFILLLMVSVVTVGGVTACNEIERVRAERFYTKHPLLKEMRDAPPSASIPNDPWPHFTELLLKRVPRGSTYADAVNILGAQGLTCNPSQAWERMIVCYPPDRPSIVPRWHIEVKFDADGKVSGGRVLMLKATAV
jgi:hypothetical protein